MIAVYIAKTDDFTVPAVAYDRDSENSMHSLADHIFNLLTDDSNLTRMLQSVFEKIAKCSKKLCLQSCRKIFLFFSKKPFDNTALKDYNSTIKI